MKNRSFLAQKLAIFYEDIQPKGTGKMCLQTDLEFNKTKLKNLTMNLMLTCFTQKCMGEKPLRQNKK